VSTEQRSQED